MKSYGLLGVDHAGTKRHGRAGVQNAQGEVRPLAEARDLSACHSGDWRLGPVLQLEASPAGAKDESAGTSLC